jgi:hypothetical protein
LVMMAAQRCRATSQISRSLAQPTGRCQRRVPPGVHEKPASAPERAGQPGILTSRHIVRRRGVPDGRSVWRRTRVRR